MANTNYLYRFVDILRSPMGGPLLNQLAASEGKLRELLAYSTVIPAPVPGAETAQVAPLHSPDVKALCYICSEPDRILQQLFPQGSHKLLWD